MSADTRFLYDGWNLIAEFSLQSSVLRLSRSYVWGIDLSGAPQGAGGVGGLLTVSTHNPSPLPDHPSSIAHLPCYDGNGNVVALVDSATAARSAEYEYGPFGETLRATGPAAAANPFGFSTKYTDPETTLLYYGYRYYCTTTGRWLSRDPIEENGGVNLYGMVGNSLVNYCDLLGLKNCNCDEIMRDLAAQREVVNTLYRYIGNWKPGERLGDYGLRPNADISGYRSPDFDTHPQAYRSAVNNIESDRSLNIVAGLINLVIEHIRLSFGAHPYIHNTTIKEQQQMTFASMELVRANRVLNAVQKAYNDCIGGR